MDERRLTAFLIMQGYLTPDQVKAALEEQMRLKRAGGDVDVIEVGRREKMLTDIQVLEILERTGYQPPKPSGPTVPKPVERPSLSDPSDISAISAISAIGAIGAISDLGEVSDPDASAISTDAISGIPSERVPVHAADEAAALGEKAAPRRGGSSATWNARKRRSGKNSALAGLIVVPMLVIFLLVLRGVTKTDDPGPSEVASAIPSVQVNPVSGKLDKLRRGIASLKGKPNGVARDRLVSTLEFLIKDIRRERMMISEGRVLERLADDLARVSGRSGAKPPPKLDLTEEANAAWASLAQEFDGILRLCLQQPRSELQLGAELHRGVNLRTRVSDELAKIGSDDKTADKIASLVSSPDLHPILGVGGYTSIMSALQRFPESLRETARWKEWSGILARFKQYLRVARAYEEAIRLADDAAQRGDHKRAKQSFLTSRYATDSWFKAMVGFLNRPEVVRAFAARAKEAAKGGPLVRRKVVPTGKGAGTGSRDWGQNWRERFVNLERAHRKAKDTKPLVAEFKALFKDTESLARGSFDTCREIVQFFAAHSKVFKKEGELRPALKRHHELYFNGAFLRATGPNTLRELDRWCATNGYEAWRAKLRGFLRLTAGAGGGKDRAREKGRANRGLARAAVKEFSEKRLGIVIKGFDGLLKWMEKKSFAPAEVKTHLDAIFVRAIERAGDSVAGARLRDRLQRLDHKVKEKKLSGLTKAYEKQLEQVIKLAVSRSLKAVERAVAAGEPGLAFDLFQYVLQLDPENDRAHKGLGHLKVNGRWLRRFDAERMKAGFGWSSDFCWEKVDSADRYAKGEVFDPTSNAWAPLADANTRHQNPDDPWVIKTEHFILRSTADLKATARVSERLEAFYLQLFRLYDLFFMDKGGAKLIFGMVKSKQLTVNYYRTQEQFKSHANPPTDWAAGFYSGGRGASFFYATGGWTVLQHEIVHQILGETSPGGGDAWLAEGAAVYLENAFFRNGVLTLGTRGNHQRIVAYQGRERSSHDEHKLLDMLTFRTGGDWDSGDISKNYRGAGAVVYFLCHFDEGRYRGDFVEFLRAAYNRQSPKLSAFFGMSEKTLDLLMRRFYDPATKLDLPGAGGGSVEELAAANTALSKVAGKRTPDPDQLGLAYSEVTRTLAGVVDKDAAKGRKTTLRTLSKMRKRLGKTIERVIKAASKPKLIVARKARLEALRAEAIRVIEDTGIYPDADHGRVGQPTVDAKVKDLREFWDGLPPVLEDADIKIAMDLLKLSEPWVTELGAKGKDRGPSKKDMEDKLRRRVGCEFLNLTPAQKQAYDYDQKVRNYNANQAQLPEAGRLQLKILNDYRIMLGRHALATDERLFRCAGKHSSWMESSGNMSHDEPDPARRTPSLRARLEGYNDSVGENVAFGYQTALSVHHGWYTSSGHHRNMILKGFWVAGVARSGTYWTQVFGTGKPSF